MKKYINDRLSDVTNYIKDNSDYENMNIDIVLFNKKNETLRIIACNDEVFIEFSAFNGSEMEINYIPEWDFNFDYYIFEKLENDYEIESITNELHHGLWNSIYELYPQDIESINGVKKYIEYCRQNNISKEKLETETGWKLHDIMKLFNNKEVKEKNYER